MRIDAHHHYWKIDRGDYEWITPDLSVLYRNFLPPDFEPLLSKHNLDGSIIVQAAPTIEETEFILKIAEHSPSVLGVIGWVNLFDPDHRKHFERFRLNPKFKGIRVMIQDMYNTTDVLNPVFLDALSSYAAEDIPVDLLLVSNQLETVLKLLQQVSGLRGVIDHIAKPQIKDGKLEPWKQYMSEISKFPGIYCKLSGMVTEANHNKWVKEDFVPYIQTVVELFGPKRVIFGSDWPVCLLAAEYSEVMDILVNSLPQCWGANEFNQLFGANAEEFYKL
ncbi:amidohydrolase family protein [Paenibacillus sp. ACRRY]|uniref:amidohydrolase family protein n=1 Tax=Paenibacillus TaxID=44249 RepID=UPI001EF7176F|nr:amidohydrolase family protein [Paenibacillus sp. ACRRY]MCG7381694.1 amidohydrolase family protein [Paenibacillus sp. ACRRY]